MPKEDLIAVFSSIQSLNQGFRKQDDKKQKVNEDDSEETDVEDNEVIDLNNCSVCKQGDLNTINRLLQCQICKLFYHCDCHKPPIPKKDDLKSIWQCFKCKNNKKLNPNKSNISGKILLNKGSPVSQYKSTISKEMPKKVYRIMDPDIVKLSGPIKRPKLLPSNNNLKVVTLSPTATINKNKTVNTSTSLHSTSTSSATGYASSSAFSNLDKRLANIKKSKITKFS